MKTEIDEINATILKELLKDGRKSFVEIAKECNTSKDVIAKRYKQMRIKGVIVGATTQNSCACFGCSLVSGMFIFTQPHKADQVLECIQKIPQIFDAYHIGINPSLIATAVMKNIDELDHVKQSIKKLPFILAVDTQVWTGVRNMPENLSVITSEKVAAKTANEKGKTKNDVERTNCKIDELDRQIIEKLSANARIPFLNIAQELKVSTDTIARRYERLKQNGDVRVVVQINPTKIGYHAYARFSIAFISQDSLVNTIESLAKIPDIINIIKTSGNFDYTITLMVKDIEQLTDIQEKIANIPDITHMEIAVSKLFNVWPLPREFISTF
jgi:Lrp/AsnC family transcriptional regulator for asnA, asnC and gidA